MKRILMLGAMLVLAGCGGGRDTTAPPPPPPQANMSGTWKGTFVDPGIRLPVILTVTIADDTVSHNLTGAGQFSTSLGSLFGFAAAGVFVDPMANVTLNVAGQSPAQLTGAVSGNSWTAILSGSGFLDDHFTLTKQ